MQHHAAWGQLYTFTVKTHWYIYIYIYIHTYTHTHTFSLSLSLKTQHQSRCQTMNRVSQYNETNVIHFSFNLVRIKGLYTFRALFAHPQVALHKRHLVYCVRMPQPTDIIRTQYTKAVCAGPPEDKQVMLETCRGPWFSLNWMKSASRWFHYTDIL
jgi:hypothetical protein